MINSDAGKSASTPGFDRASALSKDSTRCPCHPSGALLHCILSSWTAVGDFLNDFRLVVVVVHCHRVLVIPNRMHPQKEMPCNIRSE
jgi:hypothetical protein